VIRRSALALSVAVIAVGAVPELAGAQAPPSRPAPAPPPPGATPAAPLPEIKLDENTSLKASALESRMAAIVASFALLQRQAQDMQQEMKQILDERKKLVEDAARRGGVDVGDANEWAYEAKNQRYVKIKRTP
jgi:hypothetical protein